MPRVNLRKLEKLEEMLRSEKHVELVIVDNETGNIITKEQTGKRVSTRIIVRI